jgi:hypothetical protein
VLHQTIAVVAMPSIDLQQSTGLTGLACDHEGMAVANPGHR